MSVGSRLWSVATLAMAAVTGVVWGAALRPTGPLRLTVLDAGQGDSALIETPHGRRILVDCGRSDADADAARSLVIPFLRYVGVNRLDALVITHRDSDHAGGLPALLRNTPARRVIAPELPDTRTEATQRERSAGRFLARQGTALVRMRSGGRIGSGDGVTVDVLSPPVSTAERRTSSDNDNSLVLRVSYGRARLLLMGDAEAAAEESMLRRGLDLRADVLKVGHHGSRFATSDAFLRAVRPRIALISVGRHNTFGHPSPAVLARLAAVGARTYRTDQSGALTIETDGTRIRLRTHRRQ